MAALAVVTGGLVLSPAGQRRPPTTGAHACPPVSTALRADVDGDGCDDPVEYHDGVLDAGSVRARLGQPGDVVVVGRWTCGPATLALLRPATGEVFRFEAWARPGHPALATAVTTMIGAVRLRKTPAAAGCDGLEVVMSDGRDIRIAVAG